ncbi:MAG: hypothetical protein ACREFR_00800 [Limisphaerales bacterium]
MNMYSVYKKNESRIGNMGNRKSQQAFEEQVRAPQRRVVWVLRCFCEVARGGNFISHVK